MKKRWLLGALFVFALAVLASACSEGTDLAPTNAQQEQQQNTDSAAERARAAANQNGASIEVKNIEERIIRTNNAAQIQYVYIISPFTGDIIVQATAVGKVTSTGKRLQESQEVNKYSCGYTDCTDFVATDRVQPDGSYGSSTPGVFWFDTAGIMHEVRVGGAMVYTTERPYIFEDNKIDLSVDIRLQADLDPVLEAQRLAIEEWLKANPSWNPGDPIPLSVLEDAGGK